jgi:hypothetical protein
LTLTNSQRRDFAKKTINTFVSEKNNPNLIIRDAQPNENAIYKLYSDGTITREKGGWAYGRRTVFDVKCECVKPNTFFTFPLRGFKDGDTYAIMTELDCHRLRNTMDEMLLEI